MRKLRRRTAALVLLFLPYCVAAPAAEVAPGGVSPGPARIDAGLTSVSVAPASPLLAVYPLPSTLGLFLPVWRAALQDALERTGIFRAGAPRQLSLSVKVLEFSLSGTILVVLGRYELFGNPPGAPVFDADIMSNQGMSSLATGVTSLEDPVVATQNRTEVTRGIQNNITQFIDQLGAFARQQQGGAVARPATPKPL